MKKSFAISIASACLLSNASAYELPIEVTNAITNDSWGSSFEPSLQRQELKQYFLANWQSILNDLDSLPIRRYDPKYKKERVIGSYSTFFEDCEALEPLNYLDFLEQSLTLAETGRIEKGMLLDLTAGLVEKQNFLSINYEHPRVAAILQRKLKIAQNEDSSWRELLEKSANGDLADNYLTNQSTDAPLPQTLPGIKLKRPWGSLIKKYEKITGTKVPPDPDFPEEPQSRPERRPRQSGMSDDSQINTARQTISPTSKSMIVAMAALSFGGLIWMWARWRKRRER